MVVVSVEQVLCQAAWVLWVVAVEQEALQLLLPVALVVALVVEAWVHQEALY